MIHIGKPYIEEKQGEVRLVSHVKNELEKKEIDLYYSVESEYAQYLCVEQADAFVIPLLLRAVVTGQEVKVDAPLSEKLLHNLQNGVLYAMTKAYEKDKLPFLEKSNDINSGELCNGAVSITSSGVISKKYGGKAVGTGCSLGVDSFSVIKKYLLDEHCPIGYKITHFTCFNVGAFGLYNTDGMRSSFRKEVAKLKKFSEKLSIPVVSVDSNMRDVFPERNFNWSHSYLNMGCVLALQKLWSRYLYASGYSVDNIEFEFGDSAKYEPFLLPNISTESTELVLADMEKTRSDKVRYIMDEPIVKQNINVCLRSQYINDGKIKEDQNDGFINCGHCEKCMRTLLQLDIFGKLNEFSETFNLDGYETRKQSYLAKVIACKDEKLMYADICSTIPDDYVIPNKTKREIKLYLSKKKLHSLLSKIKHLFG